MERPPAAAPTQPVEPTAPEKLRVVLVCSSGGHLAHLMQLRPWWSRHDRHWVTFGTADARSLLTDEVVTWAHHPTTRNLPNLARNAVLAWRLMRTARPDVVVSSGAGVALPFFVLSRFLRVRAVYLEVYDRIDLSTLTGRLCHPLADLFLLQWQQQRRNYPKGVVVGQLF